MDHRSYLLGALILVVTAIVYAPLANATFVYEDHNGGGAISAPWRGFAYEGQESIRTVAHLGVLPDVRYFTSASYRLNAAVSTAPRGYHLVNVALHLLNGVLVAALAVPVLGGAAVIVMGLFLLHPIQVEAVAAVVNRSELLATGFALGAVLCAARGRGGIALIGTMAFGLGACYAKETTASGLLVLLPLGVYACSPDRARGRWQPAVAVWGIALAVAVRTLAGSPELHLLTWAGYLAHVSRQIVGVALLVGRTLIPLRQTIDLGLSDLSLPLVVGLVVLVAAGLGAWGFTVAGRASIGVREAWALWAVVWVIGAVGLRVVAPQPEPIHEHAFYLPMAGLSVAMVAAWVRAPFDAEVVHHG